MDNSKLEAIKDRARKILAVLRSNPSDGERAAAMARLQDILTKYHISIAEVGEKEPETVHTNKVGRNAVWIRSIYQSIAKLNYCEYLVSVDRKNYSKAMHYIIGKPHEVEIVYELAGLIVHQLGTEAKAQQKLRPNPSFERSFLNGAAQVIWRRVNELMQSPNAVTIYKQAEESNKAYSLAVFKPKPGRTVATRNNSLEGLNEGREFAKKIPLHRTKKLDFEE